MEVYNHTAEDYQLNSAALEAPSRGCLYAIVAVLFLTLIGIVILCW